MPLATTKIWPVRDSLRRVVDYAANPDKTQYGGLAQALHYAGNGEKTNLTETVQLVSGIHCRPETAWREMRAVQEQFGKTRGVVAMHAYQSFKPGEVTPEQCHAIGVKLARKVWGDRFQVLVATHLNTDCLHNHFVINAVSYVDGKKYEQRRSQYQDLRRISDQLCRENALSVIEKPKGKKPLPLYQAQGRGEPLRYQTMREDIQTALSRTNTDQDFARVLRQLGYAWNRQPGRKYATLRPLDGGRAVRVYRLGKEYDWSALDRKLQERCLWYGPHYYDLNFNPKYSLRPRPPYHLPTRRYRCRGVFTDQKSSLFRLYLYYCYQLGIYPKRPTPRVNWPEINAQWRQAEKSLEELNLMTKYNLNTLEAVAVHRQSLGERIKELTDQRADCARLMRRKDPPAGTAQRRADLTKKIKALGREDQVAQRIQERVKYVQAMQEEYHRQRGGKKEPPAGTEPCPVKPKACTGAIRCRQCGGFVPKRYSHPCAVS